MKVVQQQELQGTRFEVIEYARLSGADDPRLCQTLYFAQQAGARLRQLRIVLTDSAVRLESGALAFSKGRLEMESGMGGVTGLLRKMTSALVSSETVFKPVYRGTGEVYLEPTFGHVLLVELNGESLVADPGMYLASTGDIDVGVGAQKSISATLFGHEGMFQTKIRGSGVVALQSPVPADEAIRVPLDDEVLRVDGNYALLRKGDVDYTVERSGSVVGTLTGGEGLLHTFRGTGEVWLAPTQAVYDKLREKGLPAETGSQKTSDTQVDTTGKVK